MVPASVHRTFVNAFKGTMNVVVPPSWANSSLLKTQSLNGLFSNGLTAPWGPRPSHFSRLHDHTL
jgi:hypothetical protein